MYLRVSLREWQVATRAICGIIKVRMELAKRERNRKEIGGN